MNIKKAYYYLFYKLYLFFKSIPGEWDSDRKACGFISLLEGLIIFQCLNYYSIFFNRSYSFKLYSPEFALPLIIFFVLNYFAFTHDQMWERYVSEFEKWPETKNLIGTIIILVIIMIIIGGLLLCLDMVSKIDWMHRVAKLNSCAGLNFYLIEA